MQDWRLLIKYKTLAALFSFPGMTLYLHLSWTSQRSRVHAVQSGVGSAFVSGITTVHRALLIIPCRSVCTR